MANSSVPHGNCYHEAWDWLRFRWAAEEAGIKDFVEQPELKREVLKSITCFKKWKTVETLAFGGRAIGVWTPPSSTGPGRIRNTHRWGHPPWEDTFYTETVRGQRKC